MSPGFSDSPPTHLPRGKHGVKQTRPRGAGARLHNADPRGPAGLGTHGDPRGPAGLGTHGDLQVWIPVLDALTPIRISVTVFLLLSSS